MSPSGLFKHIRRLEDAGIVRKESCGLVLKELGARKAIYLLEGKERVENILQQLKCNVVNLLVVGEIFNRTAKLARKFFRN